MKFIRIVEGIFKYYLTLQIVRRRERGCFGFRHDI